MKNIISEELKYLSTRNEDKWRGSKYEVVKRADMTPKGDFGERVTEKMFKKAGIDAKIINGGKGEFDILLRDKGIRIEHKLATEDTNSSFQFNGIKKDVDYDYAYCLGVSPNKMWFGIFPKSTCNELTVAMTKNGEDSYKLTARPQKGRYPLMELTSENFLREVNKIV
jgi:hypothetical protein